MHFLVLVLDVPAELEMLLPMQPFLPHHPLAPFATSVKPGDMKNAKNKYTASD